MSQYARIDRLYAVMVELLNQPKTIDVMRKMPAYVKDGEVYDFNDRSFGATDKPDGNIFKDIERVKKIQAVTAALKRDYTAALKAWLGEISEDDPVTKAVRNATSEREQAPKDTTGKSDKKAEAKAVKAKVAEDVEFDLIAEVKGLIKAEKFKKAKKLIKGYDGDEAVAKKAKKILKAAQS